MLALTWRKMARGVGWLAGRRVVLAAEQICVVLVAGRMWCHAILDFGPWGRVA